MPLLKSDSIPLPPGDLAALRARLTEPYQQEVVDRDGRRFLFVRCPKPEPDPVVDLERACEEAPAWIASTLSDVFLLGQRMDLHVPAHYARPLFESLQRLDRLVAKQARDAQETHYGVRITRLVADANNVERLVVRVPRPRCADLNELDLAHLAERVGPLHDLGALRNVRLCHLVAEEDDLRFRARDFIADLVERWLPLRAAREASRTRPQSTAMLVTSEPPRPKAREDVTPLFEIEDELVAEPEPAPPPAESPVMEAPPPEPTPPQVTDASPPFADTPPPAPEPVFDPLAMEALPIVPEVPSEPLVELAPSPEPMLDLPLAPPVEEAAAPILEHAPPEAPLAPLVEEPFAPPVVEAPAPVSVDPLRLAETELAHNLSDEGYVVGRAPYLEASPFQLEADRATAHPRKVALLVHDRFGLSDAAEALRLQRERGLDLLLILTEYPSSEATRRIAASKVKIIRPAEVAQFRP